MPNKLPRTNFSQSNSFARNKQSKSDLRFSNLSCDSSTGRASARKIRNDISALLMNAFSNALSRPRSRKFQVSYSRIDVSAIAAALMMNSGNRLSREREKTKEKRGKSSGSCCTLSTVGLRRNGGLGARVTVIPFHST